MLVRNTSKPVEIPHEPGNHVVIRRVRREVLRKAADVKQAASISKLKDLGGPAFIKELRSLAETPEAKDAVATEAKKSTALSYDEDTLLLAGVVGFSGPNYDGETLDAEFLADLDDPTATFVADEIVAYANSTEHQQKNG